MSEMQTQRMDKSEDCWDEHGVGRRIATRDIPTPRTAAAAALVENETNYCDCGNVIVIKPLVEESEKLERELVVATDKLRGMTVKANRAASSRERMKAKLAAMTAERDSERAMRVEAQRALREAMRRMPGDVRLPEGMVDRWTAAQTAGEESNESI